MTVVDDYIISAGEPAGSALEVIREVVKQIEPSVVEAMVYGVPGFKYKGKFFVGFAAHEHFLSLYPGGTAVGVLKNKLKKFEISKGAIRFTIDNQIPESLLREIIKVRQDEINAKL
ncbi:MAG: DUF1801 domain-containing protein [Candidatus Saccharibacteria bacterium]|nr:DUF1801 domain-containing protein [Candidatus Saccharibacteria bacterium]